MDNEPQTVDITKIDRAKAGKIVRGIAQVEADFYLAAGPLSELVMSEAVKAVAKVARAPWQIVEAGWSAQVVCPEWRMTKGMGTGDAWLELSEICNDEENDHSWVAAALKAGPTQMGIELAFRRGLQDIAEEVIGNDESIAALRNLGFMRDDDSARLFVPVAIAADKLAKGFEQGDLEDAMAPVGQALGMAIAAKSYLDTLIELVRTAAKTK